MGNAFVLRPPQVEDPVSQYGKLMQLRALAQEQQMAPLRMQLAQQQVQHGQFENQMLQRQMQDQQVVMDTLQQTGGDLDKALPALAGKVSPQTYMGLSKYRLDTKKTLSEIDKNELPTIQYKNSQLQRLGQQQLALPDDQYAQTWPQFAQAVNQIHPDWNVNPNQPAPKAAVQQRLLGLQTEEQYMKQEETKRAAAAQAETARHNLATEKQTATHNVATEKQAQQNLAEQTRYHRQRIALQQQQLNLAGAGNAVDMPTDPESGSILAQTGLSIPAFYVLTGQSSSLPRDKVTRGMAMKEAQQWANKQGVDVSTMASQYKSQNEVLGKNIARLNNTKIMEQELQSTIQNLKGVVNAKDMGRVNFANVARIWAGQQVNDDLAQQYAVHLSQLRNELMAYFAATQGRSGNEITVDDRREAEGVIRNGMSRGSLQGMSTAIQNSTSKMVPVMQGSADRARKAIWDLFGVGKNFKPQYASTAQPQINGSKYQMGETRSYQGATYKFDGKQWVKQ